MDKELYDPDEFLLDNIKSFHYEVMDEGFINSLALGIYTVFVFTLGRHYEIS